MRIALPFLMLASCGAVAMELMVSDARRTELSAAVFTGTVTNVQHFPLLRTNTVIGLGNRFGTNVCDLGIWRAEVVIDSVTKQDMPLGKVAVIYYDQRTANPCFGTRICPGYPVIESNMHATFWCHRSTLDGLTNVLRVSMPSSVKRNR